MKKAQLAAALGAGAVVLSGSTLFLNSNATATPAAAVTIEPIVVTATSPVASTLCVAAEGNSARYLVQEQLVGFGPA